jgi:hypothetical protein
MSRITLNVFHICVVFPLLMYVAVFRGFAPLWVYQGIVILGILLLIYHAYLVITKWKAQSPSVWVNVIHVLFIAPLLIFIGKNGYDTPRWAFECLSLLAFAALGYNFYSILQNIQALKTNPTPGALQGGQESQLENN